MQRALTKLKTAQKLIYKEEEMESRAIEILGLKLAQAEVNSAVLQAQLEQAQYRIKELEREADEVREVKDETER